MASAKHDQILLAGDAAGATAFSNGEMRILAKEVGKGTQQLVKIQEERVASMLSDSNRLYEQVRMTLTLWSALLSSSA